MAINPAKCHHLATLLLPARKKLYTAENSRVFIGATPINNIGPQEAFKYLGF